MGVKYIHPDCGFWMMKRNIADAKIRTLVQGRVLYEGRSVRKVWPGDLLKLDRTKVRPGCLALDASGNIYLSVSGDANEILVLSPGMSLKAEIGKMTVASSSMKAITGLWVDRDGRIYATYAQGECVRVYAPDGRMLTSFGAHEAGPNNF